MQDQDVTETLRRVGWVLIVAELLNLSWALYGVVRGERFSVSVDLAALVAGYLLLQGNLVAARFVAWFAAFTVGSIVLSPVAAPMILPFDLLTLWARLHPAAWVRAALEVVAFLAIAIFVYGQLRSEVVRRAQTAAGIKPSRAWTGFLAGAGFVLLLAGGVHLLFSGESGEKAIRLAREEKGPAYRYAVVSIRIDNSEVRATVAAYDDRHQEDVEVSWTN